MSFWSNVWNIVWLLFWGFALIAYLLTLFTVVGDLFRDRTVSGWAKAVRVLFFFFVPFLTVLVYLLVRGGGMAERQAYREHYVQETTEEYLRHLGGHSASDEIAKAHALRESGVITDEEFTAMKSHALAHTT